MASAVQESFFYKQMTISGAVLGIQGGALGGFLCTTSGSLKLTIGTDGLGSTIVDTVPVTAGVFLPLPFVFPAGTPVYAELTGGAKGTFAIL